MGYLEYIGSQKVASEISQMTMGNEFYTLIMAAMRLADTDNMEKLAEEFPETWDELCRRYKAPGGKLSGE